MCTDCVKIAVLASVVFWGNSNAALLSRAAGQAYYDDVLNITWVADANLSQTSGYDVDGQVTWSSAQAWTASLNTASYLGVSDWRLPSANVNADTTIIECTTATEPNCRDNEMGYMYWHNLVTSGSPSPFTNVQSNNAYWTGTDNAADSTGAWYFYYLGGFQNIRNKTFTAHAWAVRTGDLVPVPATAWLFGSALSVLAWVGRKQANV